MSAVVGVYRWDGQFVETADVERMAAAVAHRGLDGGGVWSDGRVGLGHRILWSTPESLHEKLPLVSARDELVLTADARIDNRPDLILTLGLTGRPPDEISDGELILAAYDRWGDRAPEHLLGDFAFTVWDRREHVLLCARDRMGVRPFYYLSSPRAFAFASEVTALLALPEVPRRLNEARVADHLAGIVADKTSTFYRDIRRLPPGHCLSVRCARVRLWSYWCLNPQREVRRESDQAYAEAFRAHFFDAVGCRLRAVFPVGATLSGGLDSSSVACVARNLLQQSARGPLHTFSAIFPDLPQTDELRLIDTVLRQGGFAAHHVRADRVDLLADLDRMRPHPDEPGSSTTVLLYGALFRRAHQQGVRVVLDGLEGDTTVSHGTAYPLELARRGRWLALAAEIIAFAETQGVSAPRLLWQSVRPLAPRWVRRLGRRLTGRERLPWDPVVSQDLARRVGLKERWEARREEWLNGARTARHDHWRRLDSPVVTHAIESVGRVALLSSIEPRHPFLDSRLVEFALALPADQKLRRGLTRLVLRGAMAGLLPEEIRWRKGKADHRPIIPHALATAGPSRLGTVLDKEAEILAGYVDLAALRAAYERCVRTGAPRDALTVWRGVTLAAWLRWTALG